MYFFNINVCLKMMALLGVHPDRHSSKMQIFLFCFNLSVLMTTVYLVCLMFIYTEKLTLLDIAGALESIILVHAALKLTTLYFKHNELKGLLQEMKHFWNIEEIQYDDERYEALTTLRYMKSIFYYFMGFAIIPSIFFCFRPFLLNERVLAFDSYIPESVPYFLLFLLEDQAFLIVYIACISFDTFFATLMILIKVQFRLLNYEIERLVGSNIESDEHQIKLKKCIDHHNFLLKLIDKINHTISGVLLSYFAILVFSMCVEMFILSNRRSVKEVVKSVTYMGSLTNEFVAFYCIPGELLTSEAEKIQNCAYMSQWYENLSSSTKCAVNLISVRGQRKVFITAGKIVNLSMQSCLSTYKTVFSYYMFLMTIQGKDNQDDAI